MSTQAVLPPASPEINNQPVVTPPPAPSSPTLSKSIFERAVLLSVSREWPSMVKSLPKTFINVQNSDVKRFHATKDLYNSKALKRLVNREIALDNRLRLYALPFPLKSSIYTLAIDLVNEVEFILAEHIGLRIPDIKEFAGTYDAEVAKAKEHLGPAFDPSDYSTKEEVENEFGFSYNYLQITPSGLLNEVSQSILQREQDKLTAVWTEAGEAAKSVLRAQMAGLVSTLVDKLSPDEQGNRKIFRDKILEPMNDFVRLFDARNLTDDKELQALVTKAQQLVKGVSPQDLRDNESLRIKVQENFNEIKTQLTAMIVEAPERELIID